MCTKMKVVLGVGALVSMLGVFMSPAHATAVAVADPSFEENVVAPGAMLAPSNWGEYGRAWHRVNGLLGIRTP